ncbi:MAG: glycosyltransferase family A protein [Deltaproteobacteria bacterium]
MDPLISAILPIYNGERYVAQALESVLAQDYANIEIIVVDDGSTDASAQIVRSYAETSHVPLRYAYQENGGPAAARNNGLKLAQGDLIAFQDADDLWTPDKLSIQSRYLRAHPAIQYVICRVRFFLESGCQTPFGFRHEWLTQEPLAYLMQALIARRQLFDQIGQFDPALSPADDVDWFARAFDAGIPGYVVPHVLLHKRIHEANISLTTLNNNQRLLAALRRSVLRKRSKFIL